MNTHAAARAANARKRLAETSGPVSSEEAAPPCPTRVAVMTAAAMSGSSGLHALGSEGLGGGGVDLVRDTVVPVRLVFNRIEQA